MTTATVAIKSHTVSRIFDAPRDLVWLANTDGQHMANWLVPEGFTARVRSMDFRVGGMYHYVQISADGTNDMRGKVTYLEIDPKELLVFLQNFSDENGGISAHPMAPDRPKTMLSAKTFEDLSDGRTRLTIEWTPVEGSSTAELALFDSARAGMDGGWKGTFDKLENYLNTLKS